MSRIKLFLSWSAVVIIGLCLIAVLGTYISASFEAFRGPSKAYFWIFLIASLLSSRFAIWLIIFSLPLMPSFHLQLEYVTHPAVKYFFAYSAVDAVVGLFLGIQLKHWYEKRRFIPAFDLPPWPFGMLLIVLTFSTGLAISRNLWQSASIFLFSDLIKNIFNYKLINDKSDYLPVAGLIVYGVGILLAVIIIQKTKEIYNKNLIIFKPIIISLFISACWGIFQALTAFGLDSETISIRSNSFGYGALGFQPDIHSFAGLMIIGAVGLFGFITSCDSKFWRLVSFSTSFLCWIALILSKSRASLSFAIIATVILIILKLRHIQKIRTYSFIFLIGIFSLLCIFIVKSIWQENLYGVYQNEQISFFDKLNLLSAWRLDLHTAALKMWSTFPLLGLGLGNFYRTSAIYEFSGSSLMSRLGGENAHNYFLQTLAEIGIVGFLSYVFLLILPLYKVKSNSLLRSANIAIFAIFLGNFYSHSLIIRENYYLLMVFIGLIYANRIKNSFAISERMVVCKCINNMSVKIFAFLMCAILITLLAREILSAYTALPYKYGRECYRASPVDVPGWKLGRFSILLPPYSHGLKFKLSSAPQIKSAQRYSIQLELFDRLKNRVVTEHVIIESINDLILKINLPVGDVLGADGGVVVLSLLECSDRTNQVKEVEPRSVPLLIKEVNIF